MIFNKNDYFILSNMIKLKAISPLSSTTIKKISEETNLSISKIRKTIALFKKQDIIREGCRQSLEKTYYVTENGKNSLKEVIGGIK